MKTLALVAALVLSLVGLASPTYAADEPPAPTVVWPEVTSFNPGFYDYEFSISGMSGQRRYFVQVGDPGTLVQLPADGTFEVNFAVAWAGDPIVRVLSCPHDNLECTVVATSPLLDFVNDLTIEYLNYSPYPLHAGAGDVTFTVPWRVSERVPDQTLTWRIEAESGGAPVDSGIIDSSGTNGSFPVVMPGSAPSGTYDIVLATEVDNETYGHLGSTSSKEVRVDHTAPGLAIVFPKTPRFYPARDGYLDTLHYVVRTNELANASVRVTDAQGATVWTETDLRLKPYGRTVREWSGLRSGGQGPRPEGAYLLTVTGIDMGGNVSTATARVLLDHARLRDRNKVVHVGAATSVVDRYVRCGSLRTPSSHGWRGSLGFVTERTCRGGSVASTLHRARVPGTDGEVYNPRVRISMVGGAGNSRRDSRIGMSYLANNGKFYEDVVFGSAVRTYDGHQVEAASYVAGKGSHQRVTWSMGTGGGYCYDIKEFVITLSYQVLQ